MYEGGCDLWEAQDGAGSCWETCGLWRGEPVLEQVFPRQLDAVCIDPEACQWSLQRPVIMNIPKEEELTLLQSMVTLLLPCFLLT
ncbi:hypothetical protein BTVI_96960 [Pitangus sulphuratus]|nr:hypothetical protein BTVI_96960 [Pitangus sulphuratus]